MGLLLKIIFIASIPLYLMADQDIIDYIEKTWTLLERSCDQGALCTPDPKLISDNHPVIYIAQDEDPERIHLRAEVKILPDTVEDIEHHGLLFVPKPYITPGGRFNEMYGWDSYFIVLGLKASGRLDMARNMVDNHLYEVQHYGHVLNSNRTYHLTRSQPPVLSLMVLEVYGNDIAKLTEAYPLLVKYYSFWNQPPRLVKNYGLSRYYDHGQGPAVEVLSSEIDHLGFNHFDRVESLVLKKVLHVSDKYYDPKTKTWKESYYLDDKAMRESGFDVSCCFGPYGIETTRHIPVCLNTLLFMMEQDLAVIANKLGIKHDWDKLAQARKTRINRLLWSEERGLYFPYNFKRKTHYAYPFLATFYPLWAKIASPEQAAAVAGNLAIFEGKGGLMASSTATGCQWDAPYGWAPFQWIAIEGLRNYGYHKEADRIAKKFTSLIEKEYQRTGHIYEKYDVDRCTSDVHLEYGYESNEYGFGWTNAVYLLLFH